VHSGIYFQHNELRCQAETTEMRMHQTKDYNFTKSRNCKAETAKHMRKTETVKQIPHHTR